MKTEKIKGKFTIASLNLLNNNSHKLEEHYISERMPHIINFVSIERPDSIGVQECDCYDGSGDMRFNIDSSIGTIGYICAQKEQWEGKNYAFKNFIWYNSSTTKCHNSGLMWLSETPDVPSKSFDAIHYISLGWALLENKETGFRYVHLNTHLYYKDAKIRCKEAEIVVRKAKEFADEGYSVFLTGDMNEGTDGGVYKIFTDFFEDTRLLAKATTDKCTFHNFGRSCTFIDFCFCHIDKKSAYIDRFDIIEKYDDKILSDHSAVWVAVKLKSEK